MNPEPALNSVEPPIEPTLPGLIQRQSDGSDTPNGKPADGQVPVTLPHSNSNSDAMRSAPPGFQILGVLGRGGMGVVYHARQTKLNREVGCSQLSRADCFRLVAESKRIELTIAEQDDTRG